MPTLISKQTIISNLYKHEETGSADKNVEIQFIFHYNTSNLDPQF